MTTVWPGLPLGSARAATVPARLRASSSAAHSARQPSPDAGGERRVRVLPCTRRQREGGEDRALR